ncbi:glutamate carboxypeptidase 2 [Ascobolus immersus RN42]|uniref:Glutamate carboxypeptidase 2 n=1 Tax=Ascobolus immersus RN42 TaxID=1160509 RepID=A0A3N4IMX1_ASCIM|nr:glutamate carboxypeptidase 2 [Ascobolus immersus RN42]
MRGSSERRPLLNEAANHQLDSDSDQNLALPTPVPSSKHDNSAKHHASLVYRRIRRTKLRRDFWLSVVTTGLALYAFLAYVRPAINETYGVTTIFKKKIPFAKLEKFVLEEPKEENLEKWSNYYAAGPHLGGKNYSQAVWTKEKFEEFGFKAEIVTYDIYANYPKDHSLSLLKKDEDGEITVTYKASLEEDVLEEDPTSGLEDRIPTFHGYSASGNVTGQLVFANYGTYDDYATLVAKGLDFKGKIVLVKYGKIFRGLKVKRAQELGAVGVIIYSDPGDDGEITEKNGEKPYPEGKARNPSAVQRGSVQFLSMAPGDPTTPGWPSLPGAPRVAPEHAIPSIPSLPISYIDAIPFLKALEGHGLDATELGDTWKTGGLDYKGVKYFVGPTPPEVTVNLFNEQEYEFAPMWNVIATIPGHLKNEVVLLGNHRDAWIAGGAGDPNSGSACLIELARTFGEMKKAGWKPFRTIKLGSWDGEEYGLLGSTEWVEDKWKYLDKNAVAYINVDVGAVGSNFDAAANPLLGSLLHEATTKVLDPHSVQKGENKTIYERWGGKYKPLGSGSDFTAFQDFIGIPSLDMSFQLGPKDAIYHYHSNYDSTAWMERFGDKGYLYHAAMTKLWGYIAIRLSESHAIPFRAADYSNFMLNYIEKTKNLTHSALSSLTSPEKATADDFQAALSDLEKAAQKFNSHASRLDQWSSQVAFQLDTESHPSQYSRLLVWITVKLWGYVHKVNKAYQRLDRSFTFEGGLDERPLYKHVVYAPGRWTGYEGAVFPGLVESIEDGNWTNGVRWAGIVRGCVEDAVGVVRKTEGYRVLNVEDREDW